MALGRPRSPKQTLLTRPVRISGGVLIGSITDDFDDNSVDGSKFYTWANAGATSQETTQKLVVTADNSSADVYGGIDLQPRVNLFGSSISIKIDTYPTQSANTQIYLLLQHPDGGTAGLQNRIVMDSLNGTWYAKYRDNSGSNTVHASYVGTPAYVKISESAGVVHWWRSADGITWTEIGTGVALGRQWMESAFVELAFGHFASDIASNTAKFDNLNIVPGAISATGLVVPIAFGSAVVLEKIVGTGLAVPVAFGSPVVTEKIVGTGLAVPVAFGTPTLKSNVVASGLAVPVTFGSPTLVAGGAGSITATGLAVPVTFGSPTVVGAAVSYTVSATGLSVPVSFGSPSLGSPIGELVDNFNDNSLDPLKWLTADGVGAVTVETNGRMEQSTGAGAVFAYLRSRNRYSLIGGECVVELVSAADQFSDRYTQLTLGDVEALTERVTWRLNNGSLDAVSVVAALGTVQYSTAYDPVAHRWLRIRESAGTTYWDTSPDGATWTNRASLANSIRLTCLLVELKTGQTGARPTGTSIWDNVNARTVLATGIAVPVSFGSPAVEAKVAGTGLAVPVAFGAPALFGRARFTLTATGLVVPVTFGAGTSVQFRQYVILYVDFEQGVQLVDFESGVGAVGNLEAGLVTVDSA